MHEERLRNVLTIINLFFRFFFSCARITTHFLISCDDQFIEFSMPFIKRKPIREKIISSLNHQNQFIKKIHFLE